MFSWIGTGGKDSLFGDTFPGSDTNDTLNGLAGADTMSGGIGNDTYFVDQAGDVVTELLDKGKQDTIVSMISLTLPANVENLQLVAGAVNGTGNGLDNDILGNSLANKLDGAAGNDVLAGYGGNDTLIGGTGNDLLVGGTGSNLLQGGAGNDLFEGSSGNNTMEGGAGDDLYFVDGGDTVTEAAGAGIDWVFSTVSFDLSVSGLNVEKLSLTGSTDLGGLGNGLNNTIDGGSGNDVLFGLTGNDTIDGDLGNDKVNGDEGNDTLTGGQGNDSLTGGDGNDQLEGGTGTDTLVGGKGNDVYVVNIVGADSYKEASGEGVDEIRSSLDIDLGTQASGQEIENATLTGSAFSVTGNALNNILTGNDSGNWLEGLTGNDTLIGGKGDDTYVLEVVGDKIVESAGQGFDAVRTALKTFTLASNLEALEFLAGAGAGAVGTGNGVDNTLEANAFGNKLDGAGGNDLIFGHDGNDTLIGGTGDDSLYEQFHTGNDSLQGGAGNDTMDGGAGSDTMEGGAGNDTYVVDSVADKVTENAGQGTDTVETSLTLNLATYANVENGTLLGSSDLDLTGTNGANKLLGNQGENEIDGLNGNDTIDGGAGDDTLDGGDGDDKLTGGKDNDALVGGIGNDTLDGGDGIDTLTGGAGNDQYIVDAGDNVVEGVGQGTDEVRSGSISLDMSLFFTTVENATLTGGSSLNINGNGLNNILTGNTGHNSIVGGAGNDTLNGGEGNDSLDGGTNNDKMAGGAGDDAYAVDSSADVVTEAAGAGNDYVVAFTIDYTLGANIEGLKLADGANNKGTGNTLGNSMEAGNGNNTLDGATGNDTLKGGAGNDVLIGGAGNDAMFGGLGNDQMKGGLGDDGYLVDDVGDVVTELAGQGKDLIVTGLSVFNLTTSGANVEGLIASNAGGTTLTGNGLDNDITGNDGQDFIDGKDGNDSLNGGSGNDSLTGGLGNDTLTGEAGIDTLAGGAGNDIYILEGADVIQEFAGQGIDEVRSTNTIIMTGALADIENGKLTGAVAASIVGNDLNNILTGNTGDNSLIGGIGDDTLIGGDGNDVLEGSDGNDKMVGGKGNDVYQVLVKTDTVTEVADEGTDKVFASINYTLGANVEDLVLSTPADLNGTGNALNNRLDGNVGKNSLDGGAGNDTLTGGDADDTLIGGAGNDILGGDAGSDDMRGGLGDDIYVVLDSTDKVTEVAGQGNDTIATELASFDMTTKAANVENLLFSAVGANVTATGNNLNNVINAWLLNDVVDGKDGNDTLSGGDGNDTLTGGNGNDVLDGGDGTNLLQGGKGNDIYQILVATAINSIVEEAGEGIDTVESNQTVGGLTDEVENLKLTGSGDINGFGNDLANVLTGNSGDNILSGGFANDTMIGGGGNDTYIVEESGDKITELAGGGDNDSVQALVSSYALSDNVEQLIFDASVVGATGTGSATDNYIQGTTGNDNLSGAGGNDGLVGLEGNDTLLGGTGVDQIDGGDDNDVLDGGDGGDHIDGGSGNDSITGGLGNDEMVGGAGNDTMNGGAGDDEYYVTDLNDTIQEAPGSGNDLIGTSVSLTMPDNIEDAYLDIAGLTVTGNGLDNVMHGSEGADTMNGAVGNDVIEGGKGADAMNGGAGNDQFYYEIASESELATLGGDTIAGFEVGKDTINLYDLFADFGISSGDPVASGFLQLKVVGSDTQVIFDADGAGGDSPVTLATLSDVTSVTLADVIYPPSPIVV